MDDELFGRLLQKHMFGTASAEERQRLAEAALESSTRALELARAEEIREHLADPGFRRELIDELPEYVAPVPGPTPWWRSWLRYDLLLPVAGGAAAVIAMLVIGDVMQRDDVAPEQVQAGSAPGSQGASPVPLTSGSERPASIETASERAILTLFAATATTPADFVITLPKGAHYEAADTVDVMVTLPRGGVMRAVVRGPDGHVREVFPQRLGDAAVVGAGTHALAFPAAGRVDPPAGHSTLRVFVAAGFSTSPEDGKWEWMKANGAFQEATYEVSAP